MGRTWPMQSTGVQIWSKFGSRSAQVKQDRLGFEWSKFGHSGQQRLTGQA
ncbi:hypothetical protein Hdeb2414_s0014g00433791 [Helianthus debilis subsp. tardiflorus]